MDTFIAFAGHYIGYRNRNITRNYKRYNGLRQFSILKSTEIRSGPTIANVTASHVSDGGASRSLWFPQQVPVTERIIEREVIAAVLVRGVFQRGFLAA